LWPKELKRRRWTEATLSSRRKGDSEKGEDGNASAAGDDHDIEVDCRTIAHGQLNACFQLPGEDKAMKVSKVRTDTFIASARIVCRQDWSPATK
jgi:hypothetical protein